MSSLPPPSSGEQRQPQPQPVIQTLLESFTRCFNPLKHHTSGCGCGDGDEDDDVVSDLKSKCRDNPGESSPSLSRSVSSSDSNARKKKPRRHDHDAQNKDILHDSLYKSSAAANVKPNEEGASCGTNQHRRKQQHLSREYIEERSMKRKLEIFRCIDSDFLPRPPPKLQLRPRKSSDQNNVDPSESASKTLHGRLSPQSCISSSSSDDDEDLIRLASQTNNSTRSRFACGVMNHDSANSPIVSNVARLLHLGFQEVRTPSFLGLCFATPVRASSREDVSKLPDDWLTTEEFLQRHATNTETGKKIHHASDNDCHKNFTSTTPRSNAITTNITTTTFAAAANEITPDHNNNHSITDSSYYNEDETISSSTLYFDHKYRHVVPTRPPMPLFHEDNMLLLSRSGGEDGLDSQLPVGDELSTIIKKRSSSLERTTRPKTTHSWLSQHTSMPPPPFPTVETTTHWRNRNPSTTARRGLFVESSGGGGGGRGEGAGEKQEEECSNFSMNSHTYHARRLDHSGKVEGPALPMRIRHEGSITADSAEEYFHV